MFKVLIVLLQVTSGQIAAGYSGQSFDTVDACEGARPGIVGKINVDLKDKNASVVYSSCVKVPAEQ